jgi:FkbM family methyltransferase
MTPSQFVKSQINTDFSISDSIVAAFRDVYFRGKGRLFNSFYSNAGLRRARVFDSVFELDLGDLIQRKIYLGTFEPRETRLARTFLGPGMTFVDVGANVGYYTALAAKHVAGGAGRVIAFEPSPYAFQRLHSMVVANRLEHITAVNAGLSDASGRRNLYLGVDSRNHTPTMVAHGNSTATEVPVVTLDAEAERLGIERIDLMKIDVEGHEPRVLNGAKRLLSEGRIRAVLCEFNEFWLRHAGSSSRDLEQLFERFGLVEVRDESVSNGFDNRVFRLMN